VSVPRADQRHQLPPADRSRRHAADESRRRVVSHHLAPGVEVVEPWWTQNQPRRFEL
jgi:hypothetical protein